MQDELIFSLEDELAFNIKKLLKFVLNSIVSYTKSIKGEEWDSNETFLHHYENCKFFRDRINEMIDFLLYGFKINAQKTSFTDDLEKELGKLIREEIFNTFSNKTKRELIDNYYSGKLKEYITKVDKLVSSKEIKNIDAIANIIVMNFANALLLSEIEENAPICMENGESFRDWRKKGSTQRQIFENFIKYSIYFYFKENPNSKIFEKCIENTKFNENFEEMVCFTIDDYTKEDFFKKANTEIANAIKNR